MSIVHIRCTNAQKFTVPLDVSLTVLVFKNSIADQAQVPADAQRLIYKGRILKDDQTLESYGVENDTTIHLVRSTKPTATTTPSTATAASTASSQAQSSTPSTNTPSMNLPFQGMMGGDQNFANVQQQLLSNPEMMSNMMNSPMMQGLLNNPEVLQSMISSNPQMRQLLDNNPQLAHVFNDPAIMRQSLEMMRNPAAMREAMRSQDLAMSNLETHPEGFNALRRMYTEVQEPMMEAMSGVGRDDNSSTNSSTRQNNSANANNNQSSAMPNPWAPTPPPSSQPAQQNTTTTNPWSSPATNAGAGNPSNFGVPDTSAMMSMLQNPVYSQMMQQIFNDPAMVDQMMATNPQFRSILEASPEMRTRLPQIMSSMADPSNFQAMMQMQQSMAQLQRSGVLPPGPTGLPGQIGNPNPSANIGGLNFSSLLNQQAFNPPPPPSNPSEAYATQLTQLRAMGFSDEEANVRAIVQARGNVNTAVEHLLNGV
mmetsp:Transcript_16618/g.24603  ORF Transcript_16618/g.24603 Transcript_16618/m.24603 type:complete len:482 (-) Transcript_16618:144-1589(-)|eukprot:CAMPEP_0171461906 /NCGR_PEP_ID=MMETSP0945-20130129/6159_1 /TAXON_ID=109269 /ORGANISM="Vaucheria litorea, Strain CCMP2940" /LENGTH=481 /DNA_ID=CAMNT_0011988331 /DNA_START=38 /DNA_END=1483 /DNA_ORIENTATION=-